MLEDQDWLERALVLLLLGLLFSSRTTRADKGPSTLDQGNELFILFEIEHINLNNTVVGIADGNLFRNVCGRQESITSDHGNLHAALL